MEGDALALECFVSFGGVDKEVIGDAGRGASVDDRMGS